MKYMLLFISVGLCYAGKQVSRPALINTEYAVVYSETPSIDHNLMKQRVSYDMDAMEIIDSLPMDKFITVLYTKKGLSDFRDVWAFIKYEVLIDSGFVDTILQVSTDSLDTCWIYDERKVTRQGWILESVRGVMFIHYLDGLNKGGSWLELTIPFFLFGQSADVLMKLENKESSYRWWGLMVVGIAFLQFFVVFFNPIAKSFGIKKTSTKVKVWFVMLALDGIALLGMKLNDILILIKGQV